MQRPAPAPGERIEIRELTKRYGDRLAVDHLTFDVEPGRVTGFLGPNGAGKSTTMRLILGLDTPDEGSSTIGGQRYVDLARPLRVVGALLEARALHPGRSARDHLRFLARTQQLPDSRVDHVLEMVGLREVADQRVKSFSLGMGQRLGIAAALLGDPGVLMLDEPVNGLDPEGVRWIRLLLQGLAAEGRTILLSSHLMQEMALTAGHLIVIGRGRLIADCSTDEFIGRYAPRSVLVRTPAAVEFGQTLDAYGAHTVRHGNELEITGLDTRQIGELAAGQGIVLHELSPHQASLEDAFMELTRSDVEYRTDGAHTPDHDHEHAGSFA
jgi:ABC-2 type transport system ATP-binding protein